MRWFFLGVIIGLLILELKVLGGATGRSFGTGVGMGARAVKKPCGCNFAASGDPTSIAPGHAKAVLRSPSNYGNRLEPPKPQPSSWNGLINPSFALISQ